MTTKNDKNPDPLKALSLPADQSPLAVASAARVQAEIQSAYLVAMHKPRDEVVVWADMSKDLGTYDAAVKAFYSYPRGGDRISGPSVRMARELARRWGNMRSGIKVIEVTDEHVHIAGWALDLQTNAYSESDDRFKKLVQRSYGKGQNKVTKWVEPDERDLRELIARRGAILERNCILKLLPRHRVDELVGIAIDTFYKAENGQLAQSRDKTIEKLINRFSDFGVNGKMLEAYLGHPVSQIDNREYQELVTIGKALGDGTADKSEFFGGTAGNTIDIGKMTGGKKAEDADIDVEVQTPEQDPDGYEEHEPANTPAESQETEPESAPDAPESDPEPEPDTETPPEAPEPSETKSEPEKKPKKQSPKKQPKKAPAGKDPKKLGEYFKESRKAKSLTYGQVKEHLNLSVAQLSQIEKGNDEVIAGLEVEQLESAIKIFGSDADMLDTLVAWAGL